MDQLISDLNELPQIGAYLVSAKKRKEFDQRVVDALFLDRVLTTSIDLGIVVYLKTNRIARSIDRISLSKTVHAEGAVKVSAKPFHEIRIRMDDPQNIIAQSIRSGKHCLVEDWYYLFTPALTPDQARMNQAGASIESSLVMPLSKKSGALIFSYYQPALNIGEVHISVAKQFVALVEKVSQHF
jgi:hypothetical protein